jgi:outer membrane assembly lipoprotein YfiO
MRSVSCLLLLLATLCTLASAQQPSQSWVLKRGEGWLPTTKPTTAPIQDETLDRAEEMLQNKQATAAKKIVLAWIRSHKDSPIRDRAVYLVGQANYLLGERLMAFYNFDEVLDLYPDSRYFYPALERQFEIADAYLKGYKNEFLGMRILEAKTEATEMLYRIQQRSPGSPLAEQSLLRVADFYFADGQFDVAADAYAAYIKAYPRSPLLARVRLRQAFSSLAQFHGVKFDATPVIDARQQLLDLASAYPKLAEEENVAAIIQRIDSALVKKFLTTADFYIRTHKPQAAAYNYRFLVLNYPDSPEAAEARQKLATLPETALKGIQPPGTPAATQPALPVNRGSR